ncbi:PREDICTED: pentatricopeptide repeat-containing protein At3g29230 [Tarenaya hassleriana]|uniref:pentatricopeptide repeat-containing protein At3g29230 n=1 Tax=Tarenaya hassleriana TaxID=28532 RepID=UPI0008FD0FD3|nr:PREDICTED: pentatricopeptide repeat-containing protein At3g29230 [Tarenaya hassleriana]
MTLSAQESSTLASGLRKSIMLAKCSTDSPCQMFPFGTPCSTVIESAYKVFCEMVERNVVAWTSMISGYILNGDLVCARRLFDLAPERDVVLWNTMVSGYIESGNTVEAKRTFDRMPQRDVMSWNTMLNGYANVGDSEACEGVFDEMPERNVFTWNGLIKGFARNEKFSEVLYAFRRMVDEGNVLPNAATVMMVLSACAKLGALDSGKWVHQSVKILGYNGNLNVENALIDMYAKCGGIDVAVEVFKGMEKRDLISWNTLINGLAVHGYGTDALNLFQEMKNCGLQPDHITFVGVLCACTHMGFVEDGLAYFSAMLEDYSLIPQIEHCGCVVDLLSRAGLLTQAVEFVDKMPVEADAVIWAALLGASRVYKNVEVGELALEKLVKFEPRNPANYVMLSNIYGDHGRWEDVARLKLAMRDTGVKKVPGISLIETDDGLVEFYSSGEKHPQSEEIYKVLKGLMKLLRTPAFVPEVEEIEIVV